MVSSGLKAAFPTCISVQTQHDLYVAPGRSVTVPIVYGRDNPALLPWVCRGEAWLTTLLTTEFDRPTGVRVVNVTQRAITMPARTVVAYLVEKGPLPGKLKCVRVESVKYAEWQQLIYESSHSRRFARRQDEADDAFNRSLPPAVPKPEYSTPTKILQRPVDREPATESESEDAGTEQQVPDRPGSDSVDETPECVPPGRVYRAASATPGAKEACAQSSGTIDASPVVDTGAVPALDAQSDTGGDHEVHAKQTINALADISAPQLSLIRHTDTEGDFRLDLGRDVGSDTANPFHFQPLVVTQSESQPASQIETQDTSVRAGIEQNGSAMITHGSMYRGYSRSLRRFGVARPPTATFTGLETE